MSPVPNPATIPNLVRWAMREIDSRTRPTAWGFIAKLYLVTAFCFALAGIEIYLLLERIFLRCALLNLTLKMRYLEFKLSNASPELRILNKGGASFQRSGDYFPHSKHASFLDRSRVGG